MIRSIEKKTGTYADALEAIGWSHLMRGLGLEPVEIRDVGSRFLVTGEGEPDFTLPAEPGFLFVADLKNPAPGIAHWKLDYETERGKEEAQREFEKSAKKKSKSLARPAEADQLQVPDPPKPELKLAKMISSMRKGWNADRELAHWIGDHPAEAQAWIQAAANGESYPNTPDLSNTQLLNPATGKGVSASKTQAKSAGSLPGALTDPFAEWMKLRGVWQAMIAYRSGEDFKFMVLEPGRISPDRLRKVRQDLEALNLWGGVRLDIEATLKCTVILIASSEAAGMNGRKPRDVIRGLRQAFFKSLGTAAALMNEALLPLPDWFGVKDRTDADTYLRIIQETVGDKARGGCLGVLDEDKSDEGAVLQQYRSWLATGDFRELMDFHREFGALMLRKAAAGDYTRLFKTEILDELLIRTYGETDGMLKEIIENEGFRSLARGIRNTTIYAVAMSNSNREVQFGLAQKWKQKMHGDEGEFSAALADFVQANNWEVVHKLKGRGHQITTSDLDQVFGLISRYGEEKVGSLLLAYGYSRAPKVEAETEATEEVKAEGDQTHV
jgi:hypothetical protein